ncbi:MAG: sensor histidine kinase [Planctomycetota bacterium]
MARSRTFLFVGSLLVALATVSVLAYVGLTQYGEIDPAVRRTWRKEAEAFLELAWSRAENAWLEVEKTALEGVRKGTPVPGAEGPGADPGGDMGFLLRPELTVLHPPSWGETWMTYSEVGPDDRVGSRRFSAAEVLEFREGALEKALNEYRSLTTSQFGVTLRNRARLAAGGVAFKLGKFREAAGFYRLVLHDPARVGIAPWIRATAAFREAECHERTGDRRGAFTRFRDLLDGLVTKSPGETPFSGIEGSLRAYFVGEAMDHLARNATEGKERKTMTAVKRRWALRLREDATLEVLRTWVLPALRAGGEPPSRRRIPVSCEGQRLLAVVERSGEGWTGVLLDPARNREAVARALPGNDPRFTAALHAPPSDGSPRSSSAALFIERPHDAFTLSVRPRDGDAVEREVFRRKTLLLGLLLLAGIVLLAGTVLVLRRLKKEMDLSRLKSDFLAGVSHDFRTPLAIIRSSAETLRLGRVTDPEKTARYLDVILKETVRLDGYVGNVLEAARLELGRERRPFVRLDPAARVREVEDARRLFLEEEGFRFEVESEADLPAVSGDAETLRSALFNLIENAVKYSGKEREITLRTFRRGETVVISLADRGVGVDAEEKRKIFERFYRSGDTASSTKGLGLGLALVLDAAKAHGGKVEVEAREGGGTVFSLVLPVAGPRTA